MGFLNIVNMLFAKLSFMLTTPLCGGLRKQLWNFEVGFPWLQWFRQLFLKKPFCSPFSSNDADEAMKGRTFFHYILLFLLLLVILFCFIFVCFLNRGTLCSPGWSQVLSNSTPLNAGIRQEPPDLAHFCFCNI